MMELCAGTRWKDFVHLNGECLYLDSILGDGVHQKTSQTRLKMAKKVVGTVHASHFSIDRVPVRFVNVEVFKKDEPKF